jgi:hypothetical protein
LLGKTGPAGSPPTPTSPTRSTTTRTRPCSSPRRIREPSHRGEPPQPSGAFPSPTTDFTPRQETRVRRRPAKAPGAGRTRDRHRAALAATRGQNHLPAANSTTVRPVPFTENRLHPAPGAPEIGTNPRPARAASTPPRRNPRPKPPHRSDSTALRRVPSANDRPHPGAGCTQIGTNTRAAQARPLAVARPKPPHRNELHNRPARSLHRRPTSPRRGCSTPTCQTAGLPRTETSPPQRNHSARCTPASPPPPKPSTMDSPDAPVAEQPPKIRCSARNRDPNLDS